MKNKNKIPALIILFTVLIIAAIPACKKYQDGPLISIHTRTERVCNTWKVDNYKINGTDYTSFFSGYTETYSKNGDFFYSWGNLSGTGKWAFQNEDAEVRITGTSNQSSETLFILKLEEKQFWYYYMDGNDKKEFHMIEN